MTPKAIGILGAGNVGSALAHALTAKGESVLLGVPVPDKYRDTVAGLGPRAAISTTESVIEAADLVILAVPYAAAIGVARSRRTGAIASSSTRRIRSLPDWPGCRSAPPLPARRKLQRPRTARVS
jgi:prephenate dehydrogenase